MLLDTFKVDPSSFNHQGQSPLYIAITRQIDTNDFRTLPKSTTEYFPVIEELLKHGADATGLIRSGKDVFSVLRENLWAHSSPHLLLLLARHGISFFDAEPEFVTKCLSWFSNLGPEDVDELLTGRFGTGTQIPRNVLTTIFRYITLVIPNCDSCPDCRSESNEEAIASMLLRRGLRFESEGDTKKDRAFFVANMLNHELLESLIDVGFPMPKDGVEAVAAVLGHRAEKQCCRKRKSKTLILLRNYIIKRGKYANRVDEGRPKE